MKKLVLVFSFALMLTLLQVPTYAAASDYATVIWEQVELSYGEDTQIIKVSITGVVGKQLNSHQVDVADVPVTILKDFYMEPTSEEGIFATYDEETYEETKFNLADKIDELKETYGTSLTVIPVVEGAKIIIEQVSQDDNGGYEGYPGSYDFIDDTNALAIRGMGQAGEYSVGENSVPSLKEGEDMKRYMLELPVANSEGIPIVVLTVSDEKAAELLAAMDTTETTPIEEPEAPVATETPVVEPEAPVATETPVVEPAAPVVTEIPAVELVATTNDTYEVTVALGDTVGLLSVRYYGNYSMINEIYTANKAYFAKTGDKLNKGDTLVLPKAPTCQVPVVSETVKVYTVKAGDTLATIAYNFYKDGSKYTVIFDANKDKLTKASLVYEGQVLAIPVIK